MVACSQWGLNTVFDSTLVEHDRVWLRDAKKISLYAKSAFSNAFRTLGSLFHTARLLCPTNSCRCAAQDKQKLLSSWDEATAWGNAAVSSVVCFMTISIIVRRAQSIHFDFEWQFLIGSAYTVPSLSDLRNDPMNIPSDSCMKARRPRMQYCFALGFKTTTRLPRSVIPDVI